MGAYQCAEDDCEEVELRGRVGEPPQEEGDGPAAEGTCEHDPWVWEDVAEVSEDDLAYDGGGVEYGKDNGRGER